MDTTRRPGHLVAGSTPRPQLTAGSTPRPQLTAEQRELGLTSKPLHDRARRAGIRIEKWPGGGGAQLIVGTGAVLLSADWPTVEAYLTARGW
jgi:hypothetical protein